MVLETIIKYIGGVILMGYGFYIQELIDNNMILYPHQQSILDSNPKKIILSWFTSAGKTLALIELAKKNGVIPLIVCPKSIKERWQRDCPKSLVLTKEEFRKKWFDVPFHDCVIIDEIHHFSGKSQMSKALSSYIKKHSPRFIWGSTATIFRSTPWNIFILAGHMGHAWNYGKFRDTFFTIRYFGQRMVYVPKEDAQSQTKLIQASHTFCDVVSRESAGLPPDDVFQEEYFYLTKEQEKAILKLKETESNPVVRYGKGHQVAQGHLKGTEFEVSKTFKNEKDTRIVELAESNPSMLIFAKYNGQIEQIANKLRSKGHIVYVLTGATKDRQKMIEDVNSAKECILISNCALGEGWEAPRFSFIVFASLPWSFSEYLQCIGRASRANVPMRRTYVTMTAKDSIDENVKEALERKEDFSLELYREKKRTPKEERINEILTEFILRKRGF